MKTALGYARLSRDNENSVSVSYQKSEIRKVCERENFRLVGIEIDNGISGKTFEKRPAAQRVLQAIDERLVDVIVVYRSDRLSRNGIESLQAEQLMARRGIEYYSASEGRLTGDSLDDELLRFLRAGLNSRERRLISIRTKQALARKKELGERIGGRPRYGWHVVNGALVPERVEQAAVNRIRELRKWGCSTRGIVEAMRREGYCTRSGGWFSQTQIVRILRQTTSGGTPHESV